MICRTKEDFALAVAWLADKEIVAYDTETTGLNVRSDEVIGFSFGDEERAFYIPIWEWKNRSLTQIIDMAVLEPILSSLSCKKLIMWNAAFDVLVTKNSLGVNLVHALHADALLLKHTCDENYPFGLKEVAANIFGHEVKNEKEAMLASIKANGGTPKEFYKADVSVLGLYACQDAMLTMRLFNHYSRELSKQGLDDFYFKDEVLPLYKTVTIPMVDRGVRVDTALLYSAQVEIKSDLEQLEARIQETIAPQLDLFTTWFLNKDYPPKTATGLTPKWAKDGLTQNEAWRRDAGPGANMFNLLSKFHLKKFFFDTMKLQPLNKTPTGMPQVDDEFISSLHAEYPWTKLLSDFNRLTKLKGTYIDRLIEEQEDGRFYPEWKMHGTTSGRFSGDMQQLPRPIKDPKVSEVVRKHTNRVRQFIVADEGAQLCSADYEQLEPTIFAHCSEDEALRAIFNSGRDFYSTVAIDTEGIQNVSADKKATNYLGNLDPAARQKAKTYALGIAYGMTGYKLQFEIGVPKNEAESLVTKYLAAYPNLDMWMASSKDLATRQGYIRTQSGRIRHLNGLSRLASTYGVWLSNSLELWKRFNASPLAYERAKTDRKLYVNLLNNAINFQVQGLAASILNRAGIAICAEIAARGLRSYPVGAIHDEWLFNVPISEIEEMRLLIKDKMESIMKLSVPLRTEPIFGRSFAECK